MTASVIAEIGFKINTSQLAAANKELTDSANAVNRVGDEMKRLRAANDTTFNKMKTESTAVANSFKFVKAGVIAITAAFVAAAGSVGLFAVALGRTASELEQMNNDAVKLGITTEEFSQMAIMADNAGIAVSQLSQGMETLGSKAAEAAAKGSGKVFDTLEAIGVSAKELAALKPEQQMALLSDAIQGFNSSSQLTIAKKLGIVELLPLLKQGSDELKRMQEEASKFGITSAQVAVFDKLDNAFDTLANKAAFAGRALQEGMAPAATKVAGAFGKMFENDAQWKDFGRVLSEVVAPSLEAVAKAGVVVANNLNTISAVIKSVELAVTTVFKGMAFAATAFVLYFFSATKSIAEGAARWAASFRVIPEQFNDLLNGLKRTFSNIVKLATDTGTAIITGFKKGLSGEGISESIRQEFSKIDGTINGFDFSKSVQKSIELTNADKEKIAAGFQPGFGFGQTTDFLGDWAATDAADQKAALAEIKTLWNGIEIAKVQANDSAKDEQATNNLQQLEIATNKAVQAVKDYNSELANSKVILEQMKIAGQQVGATVDSVATAQTLATEALKLGVVYTDGIQANEQAILNTINEKINVERAINTELLKQQETRKNIAAAAEVENINRNAQIEAARARAAETKSDASVFDSGAFEAGPDKAVELEKIFVLQEEALARERDLRKQYAEEEIRDKELLEAEKARIDSVYNAQAAAMEEEQARQRKAIQQQEVSDRLNVATDLFGRLADVAKAGGKKMAIVAKAAALAQATISGATAVLKALELGPIYGPPAAAIMAGLVGAQIGIIAATPLAKGGVLDSPQIVGTVGGNPALAGEAGPEAVLPLARGKDGKLGVQMNGGGSGGNTYNFNTVVNGNNGNGQDSQQLAQQIANAQREMIRQELGEQQRSGNILNPSISKVF